MGIDVKITKLQRILNKLGSVLVAYSGGLDSSLLLKVAKDCLGNKVLAVTADSETYTKEELAFAKRFCKELGAAHRIIKTQELTHKKFSSNPTNRCYFCKKELFSRLKNIATENNIKYIIDASNASDRKDYRPGKKAKLKFSVISPLDQAGITKEEIRSLSKRFKLSSRDRPQMACLASRVQYGLSITKDRLNRINKAEEFLRNKLGNKVNIRVRDYGELARVELDKEVIPELTKSSSFIDRLKNLGFRYVTVDLEGYRTGSMNK